MPSGTDLITWSPRIGATGDDRYNVNPETLIAAGSSTYSDPPTITEINAGTDLNQIIAECNRRTHGSHDADYYSNSANFITPRTALSYIAVGDRITFTILSTIQTRIDSIRSTEGSTAYSWSAVASVQQVKIQHLYELRNALAIDHLRVYTYIPNGYFSQSLMRNNNFYPPTTTSVLADSTGLTGQDKIFGGNYRKYRSYFFFKMPSGFPTLGVGTFNSSGKRIDATSYTVNFYRTNSDLNPLDTGDWGNLDNLENSVDSLTLFASTNVVNAFTFTITPSALSAGNNFTFIGTSAKDEADTSPGTNHEYCSLVQGVGPYLKLFTA